MDGRRCLPLPENSMERSPHRRLRGELSGSGRLSCPAAHLTVHGFTPSRSRRRPPVPALTLGPPLLPAALDATTVPGAPLAGFGVATTGARVAERLDRRHGIRGIPKTIRASETHPTLSPNRTFGAKCDVNSGAFGGVPALFGAGVQRLTGDDDARVGTDALQVLLVQGAPSALQAKGVGDGGEGVASWTV